MRFIVTGALSSAAVVMLSGVASPQSPQVPLPSQRQRPSETPPIVGLAAVPRDQLVTVTGCVQREGDFLRRQQGASPVTVVGGGGDFVLTHAAASVIGSSVAGTRAQAPLEPAAGGSGSAAQSVGAPAAASTAPAGPVYQLSGTREADAASHVGRWVEITGTLREPPDATGTVAAPSASQANRVTDVTAPELHLRQLEIDSLRPLNGACPVP